MLVDFETFFEKYFIVFWESHKHIFQKNLSKGGTGVRLPKKSNEMLFDLKFILLDAGVGNKKRLLEVVTKTRSIFFRLLDVLDDSINEINFALLLTFGSIKLLLK